MNRVRWVLAFGVASLAIGYWLRADTAVAVPGAAQSVGAQQVELFQAMKDGQVDAKFIARSDRAARLFLANKTKGTLDVKLPEAFAGVPLAQFGGGGGRGGRGGGGRSTSTGGGSQSLGGGLGGGGGGGGGFFSIPPDETARIDMAVVCLEHGKRDPSSSVPYKIIPADEYTDRGAVVELLKAFGRGELQHGAAQAAAWNLNSDVSWNELAAKRQGTRRNINRPPYFSQAELRAGVAYANEAQRLAELAKDEESTEESKEPAEEDASAEWSEERSTGEWNPSETSP